MNLRPIVSPIHTGIEAPAGQYECGLTNVERWQISRKTFTLAIAYAQCKQALANHQSHSTGTSLFHITYVIALEISRSYKTSFSIYT